MTNSTNDLSIKLKKALDDLKKLQIELDTILRDHPSSFQNEIGLWEERHTRQGLILKFLLNDLKNSVQSGFVSKEELDWYAKQLGEAASREKKLLKLVKEKSEQLKEKLHDIKRGKKALKGYKFSINPPVFLDGHH